MTAAISTIASIEVPPIIQSISEPGLHESRKVLIQIMTFMDSEY